MDDKLETIITKLISSLFKNNKLIKESFDNLNHVNKLYIFGGWIRDILISEIQETPIDWKDIDIVVAGEIDTRLFPNLYQNCFKGYKYFVGEKKSIHFWALNETYAFKQGIFKPTVKNLTESTVFKFNSIVYDFSRKAVYENGAIKDIECRRISFNCEKYLWDFPELQIFRALDFHERFKFDIDKRVLEFMKEYTSKFSVKDYQRKIVKHRNWVSPIDVEKIFKKIESF